MKNAPDFTLPDQDNKTHSLGDYTGQWLVLYFYPKDDTPGCTTEACNFRDARDLISQLGNAKVVGVSKDNPSSHKKFSEKYGLTFTLLSDESTNTIQAYGVWGEKSMYGRKYMGIIRSTFIINPRGQIVKTYAGVDPKNHAVEIIEDLKKLQSTV